MNIEAIRKTIAFMKLLKDEQYEQGEVILESACGTVACIGGNAILAHGLSPRSSLYNAEEILGLTRREAERLFYGGLSSAEAGVDGDDCWPEPFESRMNAARHHKSTEIPRLIAIELLEALADGKVSLT